MEVRNPRCSVNQPGDIYLSDLILDVLEQHFKQIFMMGRKGKAFDDDKGDVVYCNLRKF